MTTISFNPSGCCGTCDDFPDCLSCDDETWSPMKLNITISGAPGDDGLCDCPEVDHYQRRILWDNLNSNFQLEQESPFSYCFSHDFITDCEDARESDAILIEDSEFGCCVGDEGDYWLNDQREVYVKRIEVCIACEENRMHISSISFAFCQCQRQMVGPPPLHWSDWSCITLADYPGYPDSFVCGLGDKIKLALPCLKQQMQSELLWATPTKTSPCTFSFPCEDPAPIVGSITAQLACS